MAAKLKIEKPKELLLSGKLVEEMVDSDLREAQSELRT